MRTATFSPMSKMGRPKKDEPTEPVRIPKSTLKRVRRVAANLDMDPGDYIAVRLLKHLERDERDMVNDITGDE